MLAAIAFIVSAIRMDLQYLHETWMSLLFPHQRGGGHPVLGRYRPSSLPKLAFYWLWGIVGIPIVIAVYPFVIIGFTIRFATMTLSRTATRLGLLGVVIVVGIVWGLLALFAFFQLEQAEFLAVFAAAIVATLSAAVAVIGHDIGGRGTTITIAYPAGVLAIFLPPIVAAVLWEPLGEVLLPASDQLAAYILDELLFVFDLNEVIREAFDLEGIWFVVMWFSLSLIIGWLLGLLVTLADSVRPRSGDRDDSRR